MPTTSTGPAGEWRRRLAAGAVLSGVALGLRHGVYGEKERPAVVVEARDHAFWPPRPVGLYFLPDAPAQTWAVVRSWLLGGDRR